MPEIKLKASTGSMGYILKNPSHNDLAKLIENKMVKYTYFHSDIEDDEVIKSLIRNRTVDLSAFKIQYINEDAFLTIRNGTKDKQTARKSSTDHYII